MKHKHSPCPICGSTDCDCLKPTSTPDIVDGPGWFTLPDKG